VAVRTMVMAMAAAGRGEMAALTDQQTFPSSSIDAAEVSGWLTRHL